MDVIAARKAVKLRAKMLRDFHVSMEATNSSIALHVMKRQFDKSYEQFIEAYEVLVEAEVDDLDDLGQVFQECSRLMAEAEIKVAENEAPPTPKVAMKLEEASDASAGFVSTAKLPLIQLQKFTGNPMEWVSFIDLYNSLVHERKGLPVAEKHYYLRSCLAGEALSLVRHLPVDATNYEVALGLLKDRYQNTRLLADTYLDQILSLPAVPASLDGLRQTFYNPLQEATQALQKLGLPVAEWSYLMLYITLQKLPSNVRNQFEERCGATANELPTFSALMKVLDEICRRHLISTPGPEQDKPGPSRPRTTRPLQGPAAGRRSPPLSRARGQVQVTTAEVRCCQYCSVRGHTIVQCKEYRRLSRQSRKAWARTQGLCFKCLGKHFARECADGVECGTCGSQYHHPLLCGDDRSEQRLPARGDQRVRTPSRTYQPERQPQRASPPRGTPPRSSTPVEYERDQPTRPRATELSPPRRETPRPYAMEPGVRRVGERYQRAQEKFQQLRYGLQTNLFPSKEAYDDDC